MGRPLLAALAALGVFLLVPALVSAYRAPTDQELAELTAAAGGAIPAGNLTEHRPAMVSGLRGGYMPVLVDARISTVDESWAAALLEPMPSGDPGTGIFKNSPVWGWQLIKTGGDCGLSHGIGMPTAVQQDLGVVDCTTPQAMLHSAPPQVICATTYGPVGVARGAYRTRPRSCNFHKRGAPVDYADIIVGKQLRWLHWGETVALGEGKEAANLAGLVPMKVRLTEPVTVCGHTVFTEARFKFPSVHRGFGRPLKLDNALGNC